MAGDRRDASFSRIACRKDGTHRRKRSLTLTTLSRAGSATSVPPAHRPACKAARHFRSARIDDLDRIFVAGCGASRTRPSTAAKKCGQCRRTRIAQARRSGDERAPWDRRSHAVRCPSRRRSHRSFFDWPSRAMMIANAHRLTMSESVPASMRALRRRMSRFFFSARQREDDRAALMQPHRHAPSPQGDSIEIATFPLHSVEGQTRRIGQRHGKGVNARSDATGLRKRSSIQRTGEGGGGSMTEPPAARRRKQRSLAFKQKASNHPTSPQKDRRCR